VYGLVADEWGRWLVVEEYFRGGWIQKFPGGGVEPHEGLIEALQREFWEELQVEVRRVEHFYTTDFFSGRIIMRKRVYWPFIIGCG